MRSCAWLLCLSFAVFALFTGQVEAAPLDDMATFVNYLQGQIQGDLRYTRATSQERYAALIESIRLLGYSVPDDISRDFALSKDDRKLAQRILDASPGNATKVKLDVKCVREVANNPREGSFVNEVPGDNRVPKTSGMLLSAPATGNDPSPSPSPLPSPLPSASPGNPNGQPPQVDNREFRTRLGNVLRDLSGPFQKPANLGGDQLSPH